MTNTLNRRSFFKVAAASGATTALASCDNDPIESIIPMLVPPDNMVTGTPYYFATVCQECSAQCGMVVKTREGRAIQVEGNPKHTLSQGALCMNGIASLQTLYNQGRIREASHKGRAMNSSKATDFLAKKIEKLISEGKGDRVLYISDANSGSLDVLIDTFISGIGGKRVRFDMNPVNSIKAANAKLFGRAEIPHYDLAKAKTLINFSSDFLETWLSSVEMTRGYSEMHAYKNGEKNWFYHVSPHMSLTGTNTDRWISCSVGEEVKIALALVHELIDDSAVSLIEKKAISQYIKNFSVAAVSKQTGVKAKSIKAMAKAFGTSGKGIAIGGGNVGSNQENELLQVAIHLLNYVGGSVNKTVFYGAEYQLGGDAAGDIVKVNQEIADKKYDLVILDRVNIVHALPKALNFAELLGEVPDVVALSSIKNETTAVAGTVIPTSTFFESWGDAFPRNGVYALQQPAMAKVPKIDAVDRGDFLLEVARLAKIPGETLIAKNFKEFLTNRWENDFYPKLVNGLDSFDTFWKKTLQNGGVFTTYNTVSVSLNSENLRPLELEKQKTKEGTLRLLAVNSNSHNVNGMNGNKLWLLEIPHPVTQIVWGSWLEIHPDTAIKIGIKHGDEVEVSGKNGTLILPAYVYQGINRNTVAMPGGMGSSVDFPNYSQRRSSFLPFIKNNPKELKAFKVGENASCFIDARPQSQDFSFSATDVTVKPTGNKAFMVSLDGSYRDDIEALMSNSKAGYGDRGQKGRGFIRYGSVEEASHGEFPEYGHKLRERKYTTDKSNPSEMYQDMADVVKDHPLGLISNDNPKFHDPYKFEMAIDLDRCTGCSACVVACYAENNIAVVGKERQALGREMSWLRIERYIEPGPDEETPQVSYSPQMCQNCNNAGCEPVCPVYATYHNPDGLNVQVYNRCVGTRYCANNCIYKQRRFNWREYEFPYPLNLQLNPDVTVRSKGVMEKCTFCSQRITAAKDHAKDEGREVFDGEIKTACQTACPTDAIQFGNGIDSKSKVSHDKRNPRGYLQLEEMNFKPAVTFLRKIVHPGENSQTTGRNH